MSKAAFEPCPHCGGEIRSGANFCRHCGSSDADGWADAEADHDFEDDDDFDYEQYVADNHLPSKVSRRLPPLWRWLVVVLVISLTASLLMPLL